MSHPVDKSAYACSKFNMVWAFNSEYDMDVTLCRGFHSIKPTKFEWTECLLTPNKVQTQLCQSVHHCPATVMKAVKYNIYSTKIFSIKNTVYIGYKIHKM